MDTNGSNCADSAGEYRSPVPNLHFPRQVLSLLPRPPLLIHSYHKPATTQLLASWTSVLKTIKIHHHLLFVYRGLMLGVPVIYCFLVLPIFCLVPVSVRVCLYWWVSVSRSLSFSLYLRSVSMIIFSSLSTTPFALPIALCLSPLTHSHARSPSGN